MKTEGQGQFKRFVKYAVPIVLGIVAIAFVIFRVLFPIMVNGGRGMLPAIGDGAIILLNPFAYSSSEPQRGEIVIFLSPRPDEENIRLVKRIVGLPGETIEYRQQQLFINGTVYDEPYIFEPCGEFNCPDERWILGEDEYFVMGDNRNHSVDSRRFGAISRDLIMGKALIP
jgi:signal peptidase I